MQSAVYNGEPDGFRLVCVECVPVNTKRMVELNETLFFELYGGSRCSRRDGYEKLSVICVLFMINY